MRILLVEDQTDLHRIIREMLEEDGYSVDSANDGNSGLAKAMTYDYDAIVLDLMLPKIDGWEVLERLRVKRCARRDEAVALALAPRFQLVRMHAGCSTEC